MRLLFLLMVVLLFKLGAAAVDAAKLMITQGEGICCSSACKTRHDS